MLYYNFDSLYEKCKECKNYYNDRHKKLYENKDIILFSDNYAEKRITEWIMENSNCFSYDCFDKKKFIRNIEINEKIYLYCLSQNRKLKKD